MAGLRKEVCKDIPAACAAPEAELDRLLALSEEQAREESAALGPSWRFNWRQGGWLVDVFCRRLRDDEVATA